MLPTMDILIFSSADILNMNFVENSLEVLKLYAYTGIKCEILRLSARNAHLQNIRRITYFKQRLTPLKYFPM